MQVQDIMTGGRTVHALASLRKAIEVMGRGRLASLPVVDDEGDVVGLLTDVDLRAADLNPHARGRHLHLATDNETPAPRIVQDLMTAVPHTVTEQTEVGAVAEAFALTEADSIPVLRGRKLVGMVSRRDVTASMDAEAADATSAEPVTDEATAPTAP